MKANKMNHKKEIIAEIDENGHLKNFDFDIHTMDELDFYIKQLSNPTLKMLVEYFILRFNYPLYKELKKFRESKRSQNEK